MLRQEKIIKIKIKDFSLYTGTSVARCILYQGFDGARERWLIQRPLLIDLELICLLMTWQGPLKMLLKKALLEYYMFAVRSTDGTFKVIRQLQERFSFIKLVRLSQADYPTAVIEGLKRAEGKCSIVFGIDYVDLGVLKRCFKALKNSDIVICSKNIGVDERPFLNRLANKYYNLLARIILGLKPSDVEGYHGYNTKKVQALISDVKTRAHLCNVWILAKARKMRLKVSEVPLEVYEIRKSRFMRFARLPYLAVISLIELIKIKTKRL